MAEWKLKKIPVHVALWGDCLHHLCQEPALVQENLEEICKASNMLSKEEPLETCWGQSDGVTTASGKK